MIDSLITQTLEQNNITYLDKLPNFLLNDTEKEIIKWVKEYVEKHKKTPTKERLAKEGYGHYWSTHFRDTPLTDIFDMTLDTKRNEYVLSEMNKLQIEMDTTGKVNSKKIREIYDRLASTYITETSSLTSYDRSEFYTPKKPDSILFGWETIDNPTGGLLNGEYAMLVARLGVGKSLIAVYLAQLWAKAGKKVLFIPCEMTLDQTIYRLDAFLGGFNPLVFRTKRRYGFEDESDEKELGAMFDNYYKLVSNELNRIKGFGGNIIFPKQGNYSTKNLRSLIQEHKPDVTIVDAVYLMSDDDGMKGSDWKVLKNISNTIKQVTIDLNTRILCTTQLKRTGKEMEFTTEDIAYTDAFAQDADLVMAMYKVPANPKRFVIDLLKVRHGSDFGGIELEVDWVNMRLNPVYGSVKKDSEDDK